MPFIGAQPAATFAKATSQTFTGDNSDETFTLNTRVSNPEDLEVFVSNIQQQPTTSYTIDSDGVTLRFSEAPPSGTFYVVYRNLAQQTGIDTGAFRKTGGALSGTITNFTSTGIDDNADTTTLTLDTNEDITVANGMYVSGDLASLTVDKGGIDRSGNTTRIISGRSGGNYADMSFNIAGSGGVNRQVYIDYQGNMTLDNGNLTIGTAGKGIDFSATADGAGTNRSEVLTDYEHGNWTPTASGGQTIDTVATAFYQKIGQMVYVGTYFSLSAIPNNAGQFYFGGLPFAVASGSHYHAAGSITYVGTTDTQNIGMLAPTPYSGGGDEFYFHRNDGTSATVQNGDVQGMTNLIVGFWYYTTA